MENHRSLIFNGIFDEDEEEEEEEEEEEWYSLAVEIRGMIILSEMIVKKWM